MLNEGINKIEIKIIAENGSERTYTLNITRELSGNNTLKELKIDKNDEFADFKESAIKNLMFIIKPAKCLS